MTTNLNPGAAWLQSIAQGWNGIHFSRRRTRFNVTALKGNTASRTYMEVGELVALSLGSLGYEVELEPNQIDTAAVNILLTYQNHAPLELLAKYCVIPYQLEPFADYGRGFQPSTCDLTLLRQSLEVWDYSKPNQAYLRDHGIDRVRIVRPGFHERLQRIPKVKEDIDVLFYGYVNERRRKILEELEKRCHVKILGGVYGRKRDAYIARSKIVLNVHFHTVKIMEQVRLSYLLNNMRFIVSEDAPVNPYGDSIVTVPYNKLVETCLHYLKDEPARRQKAEEGYWAFRRLPMVEQLRPALQGFGSLQL